MSTETLAAAEQIRDLWMRQPVDNNDEWHSAVLALVQALDRDDEALSRAAYRHNGSMRHL